MTMRRLVGILCRCDMGNRRGSNERAGPGCLHGMHESAERRVRPRAATLSLFRSCCALYKRARPIRSSSCVVQLGIAPSGSTVSSPAGHSRPPRPSRAP